MNKILAAITIMDEKWRINPEGNSVMLWDKDWLALREILVQILNAQESEGFIDTPESKLRRMFQDVRCNPDHEFVLFRNEIAKRVIDEWYKSTNGTTTDEFYKNDIQYWLEQEKK